MLSKKQEIHLQFLQLVDALLLAGVFWLSYMLRDYGYIKLDLLERIPPFEEFLWLLAIIAPLSPVLLEMQAYYQFPLEKNIGKSLAQITRASVWLALIIGFCVIFLRMEVPSRSVALIFMVLAPCALIAREAIHRWWLLHILEKGTGGERVILAGEPASIKALESSFTKSQRLELNVVARVDLAANPVEILSTALHEHTASRVLLAFESVDLTKVQAAIEACEVEGVEAWLCADFIRTSIARPTYETLGTRPMLVFKTTPDLSWAFLVKSFIDKTAALAGIVILSPLLLFAAAGVRWTSPGPIIFRQKRAGLHGKAFTMLKFRTMVSDAEMRKAELEAFNQMSGPVFKISEDPRITPFGRWLRRTSIDELPQLFNVLAGDMSLVGPRPLPIYEVENFQSLAHRRRLSMKPGVTCLWQVEGRNKVTDFDQWVKLDLQYIDNWSLWLDLVILARTIPAVLFARGAS